MSDCVEWQGGVQSAGYGARRVDGRSQLVHRLMWRLVYGPIPPRLCVLHRCDNRRCVNPEHLFLGTVADNNADMHAKGRARPHGLNWRRGEAVNGHKLTADDVREVRRLAPRISQRQLAARFGVSQPAIGQIVRRESWKHIE